MTNEKTPPKPPEGYVDVAEDMLGDDDEPVGGWRDFDANGNRIESPKPQSLSKAKSGVKRVKKKT